MNPADNKKTLKTRIMQLILIAIGIICILYGLCVLGTNSGTAFFAVWFVLGALFIISVPGGGLIRNSLPRPVHIACLIVLGIIAAVFVFAEIMILGGFSQKGEQGLDYLVVLGAQVRENGPSVVLKYRLDAAYDYLAENEKTRCIVSGGQGYNEPFAEAVGMKRYLESRGIDPDRILTEEASLNTKQNIDNSIVLLDPANDRVGIVTNNFHVYRGVALAKKAGIRNVCGISAGSAPFYLPNNMLREFFGVAKDFLQGNI